MIRRIPMIIDPLLGGLLNTRFGWEQGIRYALIGCIGLSTVTALFQWFLVEPHPEKVDKVNLARVSFVRVVTSFNPTLRELLVSDIHLRFCERLPYAFMILWAMN